jgi:hypothetical protein
MQTRRSRKRGQALIMVTFAMVMLFGIMAMAVDLGLGLSSVKAGRSAADAAALAAVTHALATVGNSPIACGGVIGCQSAQACPATIGTPQTTLDMGCFYAQRNGFTQGGQGGRQTVQIAAGIDSPPPTAPGVNDVTYWATVTVTDRMPRLFSTIFGGETSNVVARATAAITNGTMNGSFYLLNRENDYSPGGTGVGIHVGGNGTMRAPGGIYLASTAAGAGTLVGGPTVESPSTYIRGAGGVDLGGSGTWTNPPQNGVPDSAAFRDPMAGKGQPSAIPTGGLPVFEVPGGDLSALPQPLTPGQYYATDNQGRASGGQLKVSSAVRFSAQGGFGNYVLYGGLYVNSTVRFDPGRYVFAGASNRNAVLEMTNQGSVMDNMPAGQQNSDAGEILILTDAKYPGLSGSLPPKVAAIQDQLGFGKTDLQAGNTTSLTLHGLNRTSSSVPSDLKEFAPTAIWQDQRNSRILYNANGSVDYTSCGGGRTLDNPCPNTALANATTMELNLQAHPNTSVYGLIYQPRGAWINMQGNGTITSPLALITGAMVLQGGADFGVLDQRDSLKRKTVALVE